MRFSPVRVNREKSLRRVSISALCSLCSWMRVSQAATSRGSSSDVITAVISLHQALETGEGLSENYQRIYLLYIK